MRKEKVNIFDYADKITKAFHPGILLNTSNEKFNSMVIGWGHIGVIWGMETFTVYVRQSRYTKPQIDQTGRFTVSVPLDDVDLNIIRVFGKESGRDINKADYVTLCDASVNDVPGIKEFPLTIECEVLYSQDQDLSEIPQSVKDRYYSKGNDVNDFHTAYIGKIVDAYIIKED